MGVASAATRTRSLHRQANVVIVPAEHGLPRMRPWQSGLAVGAEVESAAATQRYVIWSRKRLAETADNAIHASGAAERAQLDEVRDSLRGLEVNRSPRPSTRRLAGSSRSPGANRPPSN